MKMVTIKMPKWIAGHYIKVYEDGSKKKQLM